MQHYKCASVTLKIIFMPSQRKRIGFLPTVEVQEIINKICLSENISQSKVTGILVDEALKARKLNFNSDTKNVLKPKTTDHDLYMIKEYLEYKKFKSMMETAISEE